MTECVFVRSGKCTLGHGQIVHGVQEIGLALAVVSADAVDVRRELQLLKFDVSEIGYYYFF